MSNFAKSDEAQLKAETKACAIYFAGDIGNSRVAGRSVYECQCNPWRHEAWRTLCAHNMWWPKPGSAHVIANLPVGRMHLRHSGVVCGHAIRMGRARRPDDGEFGRTTTMAAGTPVSVAPGQRRCQHVVATTRCAPQPQQASCLLELAARLVLGVARKHSSAEHRVLRVPVGTYRHRSCSKAVPGPGDQRGVDCQCREIGKAGCQDPANGRGQ